ncbi:MAG: thioredoxin [Cyclobacteriaceae bacterium]|nr:thioredoxin [Cyclobacteriaceae bacterium]
MAVVNLTTEEFKTKVFDYTTEKEWNFKGDKPAILDFYADWCGPCKMLSPILEELSGEFGDKVDFYKIDTEAEQELSAAFGIRSIPSILFIPQGEQPMMQPGLLPKHVLEQVIRENLLKEKVEG